MQKGKSYIRDSGDFIGKIKNLTSIPSGSLLVTADVVGLYPNIPHDLGLKALREALAKRENKSVATDELVKMAEFVLKNNYFEFNGGVNNRFLGRLLVPNLRHHMHVFLWTKWKQTFYKLKNFNR